MQNLPPKEEQNRESSQKVKKMRKTKLKKGDIVKIRETFNGRPIKNPKEREIIETQKDKYRFVRLKGDPTWKFRHSSDLKLVKRSKKKKKKRKAKR